MTPRKKNTSICSFKGPKPGFIPTHQLLLSFLRDPSGFIPFLIPLPTAPASLRKSDFRILLGNLNEYSMWMDEIRFAPVKMRPKAENEGMRPINHPL